MKIDFFAEKADWSWSASDQYKFLGGTQTWLLDLAYAFAKRGHEIRVFYDGEVETFKGVRFLKRESYASKSDIAIFWNNPNSDQFNIQTAKSFYWTNGGEPWWHLFGLFYERMQNVVCMSQFHAAELLERFPDKLTIIPGGIDPEEFGEAVPKKNNQILYASSWDRGLQHILNIWPYLLKYDKDMKLHITYGDRFAKMFGARPITIPQDPSIIVHGEMNRLDMSSLMMESDIMVFASHNRISMAYSIYLTAIKAQYAKCLPITTPHIAVDESYYGGIQVPVGKFAGTFAEMVSYPEKKEAARSRLKTAPTWDEVAQMWEQLF